MQINSKHYNSEFHNRLIEAAKICDINRLIQLIILEIGTVELDVITTHLLSDILHVAQCKPQTTIAEKVKFYRKLLRD